MKLMLYTVGGWDRVLSATLRPPVEGKVLMRQALLYGLLDTCSNWKKPGSPDRSVRKIPY